MKKNLGQKLSLRRASLTLAAAAALLGGMFGTAPSVSHAAVEPKAEVSRKVLELNFDGMAFEAAIDYLRDASGLNIHMEWKAIEAAGIDKSTPLTIHLRNVTARRALETILREAGAGNKLAYEIDEGVVEVTTQEESDKKLTTEVYDIRDLMFQPLDAGDPPQLQFQLDAVTKGGGGGGSGGNLFGGQGGGGNNKQEKTDDQKGEDLVGIITSLIRPEVWNANGGPASIKYYNGTLIISAPRSVHELIGISVRP